MAKRRRARHNNRWPKGTRHYVLYANGHLEDLNIDPEFTLFSSKREIAISIAEDRKSLARGGIIFDDERLVALVHAMPKKS